MLGGGVGKIKYQSTIDIDIESVLINQPIVVTVASIASSNRTGVEFSCDLPRSSVSNVLRVGFNRQGRSTVNQNR